MNPLIRRRLAGWATLGLTFFAATAAMASEHGGGDEDMVGKMTLLMMQLAIILIAAKLGGFFCSKLLHIPEVLGEIGAGVIIGPYAFGPMTGLFNLPAGGGFPISPELYGVATLASILLLYMAGLETDLKMFLRYSLPGTMVGIGGVIGSFILGDAVAVWWGIAPSYFHPSALFLGTISTATSVGITARILRERNKLDSPEGVTILAGAVIDDVLGIVVLAVVIGFSRAATAGGTVEWGRIGIIAAKALGFWLGCTALGLLLATRISRLLEWFGSHENMATLSLGLALLLSGLSEKAGLAMIIGAYIMGLSLSRVDAAHTIQHRLEPVYHTLVSVFFCVMGMLVNVPAMKSLLVFGLVYSLLAIVAKVIGCGIPALLMRFNLLGAFRVGIGMLPRGEVALIVAGIGLSAGVVSTEIFGVAILMTLLTTIIAPLIMVTVFDDRPGRSDLGTVAERPPVVIPLPNAEIAEFLLRRVVQTFEEEECYVYALGAGGGFHLIRKDDIAISIRQEDASLVLTCNEADWEYAKLVLLEAATSLRSLFDGLGKLNGADFRNSLLA
jgi:Kef-type K+ transport system membrane component KefB